MIGCGLAHDFNDAKILTLTNNFYEAIGDKISVYLILLRRLLPRLLFLHIGFNSSVKRIGRFNRRNAASLGINRFTVGGEERQPRPHCG